MEHLVKITRGGQVTIPAEMRRQAGIDIGDYLAVRMVEGRLVLMPQQLIDKDQAWFWTEEWQAAEGEAQEDLHARHVQEFDTLDELIVDLDADKASD